VTRALIPLERIGLVSRERNPRDARVSYATLTDVGREKVRDTMATATEVGKSLLQWPAWQPDEVDTLAELLVRLGGAGLPAAGDPVAGTA
jgi:DNA-binding MarR family transcriptional regulator